MLPGILRGSSYQLSEGRQTEYQSPRFCFRQFGSLQFLWTIDADSVAPGGATGELSEHALKDNSGTKTADKITIASRTARLPCVAPRANLGPRYGNFMAPLVRSP